MTCNCQPNECVKCVDPPENCIYRLDGEVTMGECQKCGMAWLLNGECLRCKHRARVEAMWSGARR